MVNEGSKRGDRFRNPDREVAAFLLITFTWSWFFVGVAIAFGLSFTGPSGLLFLGLFGLGPLLAALVLVARGFSDESPTAFIVRIVDLRRVPPSWAVGILAVVFVPPVIGKVFGSGGFEIAVVSGGAALLTLIVGVLAGVVEEPGWRGYALDRVLLRQNALVASLFIGLFWSIWHLPLFFFEGTYHHGLGLWGADFWMFFFDIFPTAILATWIYVNTNRSIFALVILHGLGNAVNEIVDLQGTESVVGTLVLLAAALTVLLIWGHRTLRGRSD
jgi:uncharacterized protein